MSAGSSIFHFTNICRSRGTSHGTRRSCHSLASVPKFKRFSISQSCRFSIHRRPLSILTRCPPPRPVSMVDLGVRGYGLLQRRKKEAEPLFTRSSGIVA
jgi:hypothetical protein